LPLLWLWLPSDPQAPHAQIYIGERGRHVFKLVFHGESVSAAYDEGANAAVAAAQAVAKFEEYKLKEDGGYLGVMEDFGGMAGTLCVIGITSGGDKICASKAQKPTASYAGYAPPLRDRERQREAERGREADRQRET
jgi:acetylornithine deacetylase/succinyl-diaminopimelate desuccinylase-like protein